MTAFSTPTIESFDAQVEQDAQYARTLTAYEAELEMLEDERYADTGIDESGTLGRW